MSILPDDFLRKKNRKGDSMNFEILFLKYFLSKSQNSNINNDLFFLSKLPNKVIFKYMDREASSFYHLRLHVSFRVNLITTFV